MGGKVEEFWLPKRFEEFGEHTKLWRYMDLERYCSMLKKQALFYARPDKLNEAFEGSFPLGEKDNLRNDILTLNHSRIRSGHRAYSIEAELAWRAAEIQARNKRFGISCWHMNPFESNAMWKLYLSDTVVKGEQLSCEKKRGVAIQTTVGRLFRALAKFPSTFERPSPIAAKVKYVDFRAHSWEAEVSNALDNYPLYRQILHKGIEFLYENELRIIQTFHSPSGQVDDDFWSKQEFNAGIHYSIDPLFIENVIFSPGTPDSERQPTIDYTRGLGLDFAFHKSRLDDKPFWGN